MKTADINIGCYAIFIQQLKEVDFYAWEEKEETERKSEAEHP